MARRLIFNADDFGNNPYANQAIMQLLHEGRISSATLMPCAQSYGDAAAWCRKHQVRNVGVHLTFHSDAAWPSRALSGPSSLTDAQGMFYPDAAQLEAHATNGDIARETAAQIERLLADGVDVSHADNHCGTVYGLQSGRSFLPAVFQVLHQYGQLPFRLFRTFWDQDAYLQSVRSPQTEAMLQQAGALADHLGIRLPDYLLFHPYTPQPRMDYGQFKRMLIDKIHALPPGDSETFIHPEIPLEDGVQCPQRGWEYRFCLDDDFFSALAEAGVQLITHRDL